MSKQKQIIENSGIMMSPGLEDIIDLDGSAQEDNEYIADVVILSNGINKTITGELLSLSLKNNTQSDTVLEVIIMTSHDCIDVVLGFTRIISMKVTKAGKSMKSWTFVSMIDNQISYESNAIGSMVKLVGTVI